MLIRFGLGLKLRSVTKRYFTVLTVTLLISVAIFGDLTKKFFRISDDNPKLKEVEKLLNVKNYSAAIARAIEVFDLDDANCREVVLAPIQNAGSGEQEIVAQTNFDQVVRLDPSRDSFHSANRLVLTLFHEFIHCDQHQRLYAWFRKNNLILKASLKDYEKLADFAAAVEQAAADARPTSDGTTERPIQNTAHVLETELVLAQLLSPLAVELKNAFEIDALSKVFDFRGLLAEDSEEFDFHVAYLRSALEQETQRKNSLDRSPCDFRVTLVHDIAETYEQSCRSALLIIKKHSADPQ